MTVKIRKLHLGAKKINRSLAGNVVLFLVLLIIGSFMALPLVYSVVNAIKPLEEFYLFPPRFFAINPTTDNFADLADLATDSWVPFSRYFFNSISVSVLTTGLYVIVAAMCAYVLSKHEFFGKKTLNKVIVLSMLFNSTIMTIPQYIILSKLGMVDTFMVILMPALGSTMGVFLLKQTIDSFPFSIIESARLDGCSELVCCWRIVMPSIKPGWITVIIFTFQAVWNNTATSMIFTENRKMLPTMLTQIATGSLARAGVSAAASLFVMIPPMVVFLISQSQIIETMAGSGIKE